MWGHRLLIFRYVEIYLDFLDVVVDFEIVLDFLVSDFLVSVFFVSVFFASDFLVSVFLVAVDEGFFVSVPAFSSRSSIPFLFSSRKSLNFAGVTLFVTALSFFTGKAGTTAFLAESFGV